MRALTKRDRSSDRTRQPTVLSRVAAEIVLRASPTTVDRAVLLERAGLAEAELDGVEARIPLAKLYALLEALEQLSGDPFVHLRLTRVFDIAALDALGLLVMTSPTLDAAIRAMMRYQSVWNDGERYEVERQDGWTRVVYVPWGPRRRAHAILAEMLVADVVVNGGVMTGATFDRPRARFVHAAPAERDLHGALLGGVDATFGCARDELWLREADLARPLVPKTQEPLFAFFERHLDARARTQPTDSVVARARDVLGRQSPLDPSAPALARALHMSPRTLQRHLAEEGTTLRVLVEQARRQRAVQLLESGRSIADIAGVLGYTSSAFHRAFRRWTGCTPEVYRQKRLMNDQRVAD